MDLESYHGSSLQQQQHQQKTSFKDRMTSSQQHHESVTSSKKVTKTSTTSSSYEASSKTSRHTEAQDILDEDFLKEQEFIENYIENSLKESRERSLKQRQKTYTEHSFEEHKANSKVSVTAIKGTATKQIKQDDVIDGFQKVTVSSGANEVNHFSRSISHDPENDVTSSSDDDIDDVSREMVDEDMIIPQTDPMNDVSGERSFEDIYGHQVYPVQKVSIKLRKEDQKSSNQNQQFTKNEPIRMKIDVSHDQHHHHHKVDGQTHHETRRTNQHQQFTKNQPIKMNIGVSHDHYDGHTYQDKSFEEVTYRIPVESNHNTEYDQHDGGNKRVQVMIRSPRDGYPDFESHGSSSTKDNHLSVTESQIPIDIQVQQSSNKSGAIRVMVSPNPHSQDKTTGFRPIQKKESPELRNHQQVVMIKPTAIRKSSDTSTNSSENHQQTHYIDQRNVQNTSSEQHEYHHQHNRKRSDDSEQIQIIKSIRKSSLPQGFDDSEFRRETDLQLQRQRDIQQRVSQRQQNETRSSQYQQQNSEYYKQQQYHQQKFMQHQQHLQRIQQQQKRKQQNEDRRGEVEQSHSHVVLNGRTMRRHSFDNSALTERKQDEEEQKYIAEHQQRQVKTPRGGERQQTRVRRLSYEQERDKLEEELKRLQEKEVRKQQQEEIRTNKSNKHHQQNEIHQQQQNYQNQQHNNHQQHRQYENQEMIQQQYLQHDQQKSRQHQHNSVKNQQSNQNRHLLQQHYQQNQQQIQQQQQTTTTNNIYDHQTRQTEIFNSHPQQLYSQSASNTPVIQRRKFADNQQYPASASTTPNVQRKRGKIPSVHKVGFQSEDIINTDTRRRKSNPNVILGRTDINKQRSEMDITHHSHTLPRNFGTKNKNQLTKTHTLSSTTTTTRSTRPSRSNKDVKRSNSLGSSHSISTSVLDESRMNKAQQKYGEHQNTVQQQQHQSSTIKQQHSNAIKQQYDHSQQINTTINRHQQQKSVENRVGVSVNKQRHVQQQPGITTHQILAETMKAQNQKSQQMLPTENKGLNIINGSHFKKDKKTRKTSTAFTQLTKPQPKRQVPVKPKRSEPAKIAPRQEDVYQSIKVSAKGGVITLFSEKDQQQKAEFSDSMKQNIKSSMYGHQNITNTTKHKHIFHESNDQHSGCFIQGDQEATAYRGTLQWDAASGYKQDQDTEVVYYTVCTHFFHPENNDWIQKIHRMGQARVPKNRAHNETCVFLNHLYDPDKEEIVVHKVISQQDVDHHAMGHDQSDGAQQPPEVNYGQSHSQQQHVSGVHGQHPHWSVNPSGMTRSRASSHNRSWVDQAFSDAYDTMSEKMDTTGYSTTFDELDTAFDARSIDSSISSKSGYQNHSYQQQRQQTNSSRQQQSDNSIQQQQRQHFQQSDNSHQQQRQHFQQSDNSHQQQQRQNFQQSDRSIQHHHDHIQQNQQRNIQKDNAKFIKHHMNTSSEGR